MPVLAKISPQQMGDIIKLEQDFCCTVKRNVTLKELIDSGTPYNDITPELQKLATSYNYDKSIILSCYENWTLPAGAYGKTVDLLNLNYIINNALTLSLKNIIKNQI